MNKDIDELSFEEFLNWVTGYFILSLGSGTSVRDILRTIIVCVCQNKNFGGQKQIKS